ncbi:MAG: ABC transporter substrate-binding protein [Verrucomicrobia bacterium]|nr:ABC transporter substrate-binding protein [Verrucomicrobiota bacterium]
MSRRSQVRRPDPRGLRLGYVPLTDCAPLIVAHEWGLFERHGLRVTLSRELGWATVRDKLVHGELDAAHAPCALPFALRLGLGCPPTDCCASLVLSLNGNGITLSHALAQSGITDLASLAEHLRRNRRSRRLVFGVVSLHSTHAWLLRSWLAQAGIQADTDVHIVVAPPQQMPRHLAAGNLDGFCVGEPWNSVAVAQGSGWCAALSCELSPGHPEKVLALRGGFVADPEGRPLRLTMALLEACAVCADPGQQDAVLRLLARREYLGLPVAQLAPALTGRFPRGDRRVSTVPDFLVFAREQSNDPTPEKAAWVVKHLLDPTLRSRLPPLELGRIFRSDLFQAAQDALTSCTSLSSPTTDSIPHAELVPA